MSDAGQQANEHASIQDAAVQHSSSHMNGSADAAAAASAHDSSGVADVMLYEGEELTASELAIAQAAEQVLRSSVQLHHVSWGMAELQSLLTMAQIGLPCGGLDLSETLLACRW